MTTTAPVRLRLDLDAAVVANPAMTWTAAARRLSP